MKKQGLMKASLILGIAGILTRFLGLFFRWPLIMLIGDEGLGYYQMSYPLYMFFIALASGVPIAMSKMISERRSNDDIEGVFEIVKESTLLMMLLGTGTSMILFCFAKPIINFLRWDMRTYYSLLGISFAPFVVSIMTIYRGFFQGLQNMMPTATSQVLEQIGRVIIGVGLAVLLLPKGIEYAAGGAAFGAAAGGVIGAAYLHTKYTKAKKEFGIKKIRTNSAILNKILLTALPISVGAAAGTVMNLIDSILVPQKLLEAGLTAQQSTVLYAQLTGKAALITNIPLTLSMAVGISLIPMIADKLNNPREMNSKISLSLKLSSVIALPCALGLFFLAEPIMKVIFPGRFDGIEILKFSAIAIPFIIMTQTTTSILQATNHVYKPVINLFVGCAVKVVLTYVLVPIPEINIYGAVIASISAYIVSMVLNLISVKTKIKNISKLNIYEVLIKPSMAALLMIIGVMSTYIYVSNKFDSDSIICLTSIFVGMILYGVGILVFRVFRVEDIKETIIRNR